MFFEATLWNTISAIKVAYLRGQRVVSLPVNRHSERVLACLVDAGAIESYSITVRELWRKETTIVLNYSLGVPAIASITAVSKKSNRVYITAAALRKLHATTAGTSIISTSRGVMLGYKACVSNLGGELLVWVSY